ncbi:Subtilisin-like serine protease [Penicillium atrosanguineum]|uniref:Uncharacterized protein n=1 Tax=Penicillium atrosanguineum TaxID=1132637 RepID=A0A9W9Q5E5_9EURO|nr:Subtilisin-like serine protease [Penicillium atrosanguineum]KAJ5304161.1 Subtilisin-like serine protease [Penicillium atrosanguineum]KAJ5323637.1 hypothetical protein N7476_002237 [Penicillium atrosanguineum]
MASIGDLPYLRDKILEDNTTKRILIKLKSKTLDSEDYRVSANEIVKEIFPNWENDRRILYLAIDIWKERTFIVIDINNHDYDFETAHESKKVLPVYVLRQYRKRQGWALVRFHPVDERLMIQLAELHEHQGWNSTTPFLADHTTMLCYRNPRGLRPRSTSI